MSQAICFTHVLSSALRVAYQSYPFYVLPEFSVNLPLKGILAFDWILSGCSLTCILFFSNSTTNSCRIKPFLVSHDYEHKSLSNLYRAVVFGRKLHAVYFYIRIILLEASYWPCRNENVHFGIWFLYSATYSLDWLWVRECGLTASCHTLIPSRGIGPSARPNGQTLPS